MPRPLLAVAVAALVLAGAHGFRIEEASLDSIQLGFNNGSLTSVELVRFYLDRIRRLNPLLHSVIEVNPDALRQAACADSERSSGRRATGVLHGVPVLLKDNIATRDALNTTAGSFALLGSVVRRDAGVVCRLRRAGAVVLGKANMDEWANFRSFSGGGWSARGGKGRNPYVLSATPCGSSTGSAIAAAASMAAVTLGTETDGSILCPASLNSVVGIKPTVGLTSRAGIVPITPRQDSVGPICRTVADAVHVLDAIVGYDAVDAPATMAASKYIPRGGYMQFLKKDGLRGKRIGVPNGFFNFLNGTVQQMVYEQHLNTMRPMCRTVSDAVHVLDAIVGYDKLDAAATRAASKFIPRGGYLQFLKKDGLRGKRIGVPNELFQGFGEKQTSVYKQHLATMRKHGAVVIENLDIGIGSEDIVTDEWTAMLTEFKLSINEYLADLSYSPVHSLADIIAFNKAHPIEERLKDFGQTILILAQDTNGIGRVERARIRWLKELSAKGLEKLMKEYQLDAIVAPEHYASHHLAIGGHPGIVVPAGYNEKGVPFGICFGGLQGYEPRLIEMAYAFEQATKVRGPPMFKP